MRVNVLGPLVVEADDGADVTPRGAQQRRLLAALAVRAPAAASVGQLTDLLWPGGAPSANALQAQVSKLRKVLDGISITGDGRGYTLRPGPGNVVDVAEFERLVHAGVDASSAGRPGDASAAFDAALALLRGEPFEDLADSDLGRGERARIATLAAMARAGHVEAELARGHVDEVAAELEALVATEPLDERWWALLMTARYRQGRQADALRAYGRARRVLAEELGVDPGPELRSVEQQVLRHDPALLGAGDAAPGPTGPRPSAGRVRRPAALPARLTSLLGREPLLAELAVEMANRRLVTLSGPGGAGKTSLAVELARRDGRELVVLVELAAIQDAGGVVPAVADALGLATVDTPAGLADQTSLDRVIEALSTAPALLVLDNCEHLVEAAAKLVHRLLEACPQLTVLATSREALGVPGETVRQVPPLPGDIAVALFVERALAVAPDVHFDVSRRAVVAEICARLDGLPLAIELAAARVRAMEPAELLARLDDRFAVLAAGSRTLEPRQQTLRAVVEWSHQLLDEPERIVFRRLAAFRGGATLAAAEAVCSDAALVLAEHVAGIVERLVDKSLLTVERRAGSSRYTLLQTLADFAEERLRESGELERILDRHARHVAALVAPAQRGVLGPQQGEWIELLGAERENIRAALDVAVARGDGDLALRLTAPLGWYFYMVAQAEFGSRALEDALACPGLSDPALRAHALATYGWLAANGPHLDVALAATAEAVDLLAAFDDPWLETFVYATRVMALFFAARTADVRAMLPLVEQAAARADDPWTDALTALIRGEVAQLDGDAAGAEEGFYAAIAALEEVGDQFAMTIALTEAAETTEMRGEYDEAAALLVRAIEISERVGFSPTPMAMRARLANVEALRGNTARAEQLHRELLDELGSDALPWVRALSGVGLAMLCRRTGRLDEAEAWLADAWDRSRTRDVPVMRALVLSARGYTADLRGDHRTALDYQLQALATATAYPAPRVLANSLEGIAGALAAGEDPDGHALAARLLGAADALRRRSGGPMPSAERFDVDRAERRARAALGDGGFDVLFAEGGRADLDDLAAAARAHRA